MSKQDVLNQIDKILNTKQGERLKETYTQDEGFAEMGRIIAGDIQAKMNEPVKEGSARDMIGEFKDKRVYSFPMKMGK